MSEFRRDKMIKSLRHARFIATEYSKDPRTPVGAIILNSEDFSPHSFGYNGMPRGCDDNKESRLVAPEKYLWFSHAERNAIDNAAKLGISIKGCWIVCTMIPCMDCARSVIQSGLKGVVTVRPSAEHVERWGEHFKRSEEIFKECGIQLIFLEDDELGDQNVNLVARPNQLKTSDTVETCTGCASH